MFQSKKGCLPRLFPDGRNYQVIICWKIVFGNNFKVLIIIWEQKICFNYSAAYCDSEILSNYIENNYLTCGMICLKTGLQYFSTKHFDICWIMWCPWFIQTLAEHLVWSGLTFSDWLDAFCSCIVKVDAAVMFISDWAGMKKRKAGEHCTKS